MSDTYASLAIFELVPSSEIAVAAISVTSDECVISGAWVLPVNEIDQIELVLSNRRVIALRESQEETNLISILNLKKVTFSDFFKEAKTDAADALKIYEDYKTLEPKKRKSLVKPNFFEWPNEIDFSKSVSILEEFGLPGIIQGTDPKFHHVLSAARLAKFYIDKWQSDENQRSSRKYVAGEQAITTILPKIWMF